MNSYKYRQIKQTKSLSYFKMYCKAVVYMPSWLQPPPDVPSMTGNGETIAQQRQFNSEATSAFSFQSKLIIRRTESSSR